MSGLLAAIPSPSRGVWYWGPVPIRGYAISILVGIVVAYFIAKRRWAARGGDPNVVLDIVYWAVPFGIVGGRLYHVITSPQGYFGPGGEPIRALYVWEGGLGIWGAIALGGVGALIGAHRAGIRLAPFADALAPGMLVAQAIGRLGNWFNQELFGGPTTLPWGLAIDDRHLPIDPTTGTSFPSGTLFHPTFLYEMVWCLAAAVVLVWLDRRFQLGYGRVGWLCVTLYCAGRVWIEYMRIDPANHFLGLRLNVWTAIVVGLGALVAFVLVGRRHPGRDEMLLLAQPAQQDEDEEAPESAR